MMMMMAGRLVGRQSDTCSFLGRQRAFPFNAQDEEAHVHTVHTQCETMIPVGQPGLLL